MSLTEFAKTLDKYQDDLAQEELSLFGGSQLNASEQMILQLLKDNPVLVQPTLKFIQSTQAKLAAAQMLALYSTQELKAMYSEEEWSVFKTMYNIQDGDST